MPGDAPRCSLCGHGAVGVLETRSAPPATWSPPPPGPPPTRAGWLPPPMPASRVEVPPWEAHLPWQPPTAVQVAERATAALAAEEQEAAPPAVGWALAGGAITASFAMFRLSAHVAPDLHRTVESYLRISVALTVLVYVLVAAAAVTVVRTRGLRLRWTRGAALPGAAVGLLVGGTCGAVLLAQTSLVTGHVVVDPSISTLLSEDTWWSTVVGMLLLVVVAPVVEEVVFRGVLAQSMLRRGTAVAVLTSAPAFWLWHWRLSVAAFVVLAGMGAVLALLYAKRGLVASMTAHATYNGVLVVVVIAQLAGPARTYDVRGLSLSAPGSWHQVASASGFALTGPSGSFVTIQAAATDHEPGIDELTQRLTAAVAGLDGSGLSAGPVTPVDLPVGDGVQVVLTAGAHHLAVTEVAVGTTLYAVEVDDEGSATATRQAAAIVSSIRTTS